MAANDYYRPATQTPDGRNQDITPHSPPDSYTLYHSRSHPAQPPSPYITSPQEDYSYRPYEHSNTSTQSPYFASGGVGGRDHEPNPFADDVPLRQHPSKQSSDIVMHNHLSDDDPAIIDRPPPKRERRREKRGFFSGKVPWVVYTLTSIQIIVFIVELAKSGKLGEENKRGKGIANNMSRPTDRDTYRSQTPIQPHDRPISLHPN